MVARRGGDPVLQASSPHFHGNWSWPAGDVCGQPAHGPRWRPGPGWEPAGAFGRSQSQQERRDGGLPDSPGQVRAEGRQLTPGALSLMEQQKREARQEGGSSSGGGSTRSFWDHGWGLPALIKGESFTFWDLDLLTCNRLVTGHSELSGQEAPTA